MFNEEHNSCESCWTVGVGARKASKIVNDLAKGPNRPQIEVTMMGFVDDPVALLALCDNDRVILDARIASGVDIDGGCCQREVVFGLWSDR